MLPRPAEIYDSELSQAAIRSGRRDPEEAAGQMNGEFPSHPTLPKDSGR